MPEKISKYRGFEIWRHDKNELTSQTVYTIKGVNGLPDIPGFRKSERAAKNLILRTLRTSKNLSIENYKNTKIYFDFSKMVYFTGEKNSRKRAKTAKTIEEIKKWIDNPNQIETLTFNARAPEKPKPMFSSGSRKSFRNPTTGRISRLREGSPQFKKAESEGWEKLTRTRVQEKTYRGYKAWRVEDGWKTELTGEEVFRTWNRAASAISREHRKIKSTGT